jgi:hypothetical protein
MAWAARMEAHSAVGAGTTMSLTLPANTCESLPARPGISWSRAVNAGRS